VPKIIFSTLWYIVETRKKMFTVSNISSAMHPNEFINSSLKNSHNLLLKKNSVTVDNCSIRTGKPSHEHDKHVTSERRESVPELGGKGLGKIKLCKSKRVVEKISCLLFLLISAGTDPFIVHTLKVNKFVPFFFSHSTEVRCWFFLQT
jgi:hypothetical protein